MDWKWFADHAQEEWRVVSGAPGAYLAAVVLTIAVACSAFRWAYQSVIAQKDAAISGQQMTITNLNGTVSDLRAEITDLRAKENAKSTAAPQSPSPRDAHDPDGIYQFGAQVGSVQLASVDEGQGLVRFQAVVGAAKLNTNRNFEYREFVLHWKSSAVESSVGMAGQVNRAFRGVLCEIVGRLPM